MSDSGWRRLRRIWRPTVRDAVDDELAFHVQMRVDQFMASGLPREEAERAARDRFGDVNRVSSTLVDIDHRRERRLDLRERFDAVRLDILVSLRALRREPLFAAGVILTFALGIGANATMFGIVDRLMLRGPAHVADASNVYRLYISINTAARGIVSTDVFGYVTYAELRDHAKSFAGVGAYTNAESGRYGTGARARPLPIAYGTWDLFPTLGVRPIVGRFFDRGEDAPPKAASVVVISEEFWRSEFGGERDVLGRRIAINGEQYTVIGVAPADFAGPERSRVDAWLPMARPDAPPRLADNLSGGVVARRGASRPWRFGGARRRRGDDTPPRRVHRTERTVSQAGRDAQAALVRRRRRPVRGREHLALAARRLARRAPRDVRERRQLAHRARTSPPSRVRGAHRARRGTRAPGAAGVHGDHAGRSRGCGRGARVRPPSARTRCARHCSRASRGTAMPSTCACSPRRWRSPWSSAR